MKRQTLLIILVAIILFTFTPELTVAQCAMCKATAQDAANAKGQYGILDNTQNQGIFYLMAIPYLIFGFIGYFWYKKYKKLKANKDFEF
jgi:hypothetical protein